MKVKKEVEMESYSVTVTNPERSTLVHSTLTLYFDGACEPKNPGGIATFGWILLGNGEVASDFGEICRGPGATNNLAELEAVTRGLRFLREQDWRGTLTIHGNSTFVIDSLNSPYGCSTEHLAPLCDECREILAGLDWTASWIPRDENRRADELSKMPLIQAFGQKEVCSTIGLFASLAAKANKRKEANRAHEWLDFLRKMYEVRPGLFDKWTNGKINEAKAVLLRNTGQTEC